VACSPAPLCFTYIQATGANSAAVITVKTNAHDPPIDLKIQTLLIPSTIHTEARHDSLLHPNQADTTSSEASPLLAPPSQLQHVPDARIATVDVDVVHGEGIAFP
jgi:hypothetical protein